MTPTGPARPPRSWWDEPVAEWWAIVPVRSGAAAKSRLSSIAAPRRAALARAFAQDALAAIASCDAVRGTILVGDPAALEDLGDRLITIADPGAGLNAALRAGAEAVPDGGSAAAVMADLPALSPQDLSRALEAASMHARSFVCDAEGIGTTMLTSWDPGHLDPRFGDRSRAAHAASGAVEITDPLLARLRRDVDSEVALWDAIRLGVGAATRSALA